MIVGWTLNAIVQTSIISALKVTEESAFFIEVYFGLGPTSVMSANYFILYSTRHAANPADPLRNPRTARVTNSERQISKLVSSYAELERVNRQRLPYLQTIQHHLGKFYTPVAAANNDSEENEESELDNSNNSNPQNISEVLNMLPA
ncbi:hypothetical protein DdX_18359 [Ditylenchus destructor]|uniref:Uncharacterized protein n=1 Tax=Ditylenchus destructor TaxID=166010 RepID=A0AAD4QY90_9BILA|nr:hypothetical protein DdX_18359 [Ditylenchus destructor]